MDSHDRLQLARLRGLIRDVANFPKHGIIFKDITPLLADAAGFALATEYMTQPFRHLEVDLVVAVESRGFIFGAAIAKNLSTGFVPVRKAGRLPAATDGEEYVLEYGTNRVEIHRDSIRRGDKVLLVDDVLATGGTIAASARLIQRLEGELIGATFLLELAYLNGRSQVGNTPVQSVLRYEH
ncbi:MAG: adenine phosphoribosyltransferase [Planctomycetes bacterium]|nr:adenine phosphoribosyltransferase [Planctomycetota bacterium]MBI3834708.1 adenine phosphoribosyltransferase [Planctomycetota bacterium]